MFTAQWLRPKGAIMSLEIEARSDGLDQMCNFQVLIQAFVVFVFAESVLLSSGCFEVLFRQFSLLR